MKIENQILHFLCLFNKSFFKSIYVIFSNLIWYLMVRDKYILIYLVNWVMSFYLIDNFLVVIFLRVCFCHVTFASRVTLKLVIAWWSKTPCLKQGRYLNFKWLQVDLNPQRLNLKQTPNHFVECSFTNWLVVVSITVAIIFFVYLIIFQKYLCYCLKFNLIFDDDRHMYINLFG